jgi:glycosyltransferase involved in cell wall biosynthesis
MKLSVVIPTIGREKQLLDLLLDLGKQNLSHGDWECLVIAQSDVNVDKIADIAKKYSLNIRVFYLNEPNASYARNIGLLEAKGDIVLFLDDDVKIESEWFLQHHLDNYADKLIPGVAGQITDRSKKVRHNRHKWSYKERVGWLYFPVNYNKRTFVLNGSSCNLSVRKEYAINVGGMDINYDRGAHREESDFSLRLTKKYGKLVFDPKASVIHLGTESGGCRMWGMNIGVHPLHHVKGEWYFILNGLRQRTISIGDLPHYLGALIFRQILNAKNLRNPALIPFSIIKSFYGFACAFRLTLRGPRTIIYCSCNDYRTIYTSNYI